MEIIIFQKLFAAVLLGALIGLEREKHLGGEKTFAFAGIRTFSLITLAGTLAHFAGDMIFPIISSAIVIFLTAGYIKGGNKGVTTPIAGIIMYMAGVLISMDLITLATVVTLTLLAILHFRPFFHNLAKKVNNKELTATMQFMIVAFVVLPILPNMGYGPYEALNPYIIWLMVVFISGISFLSYVAIRAFGQKNGIYLSGFLAGFISSTALAFSFSDQSKRDKKVVNPYVLSMVIAGTAMFFRVLLAISVVNKDLLPALIKPIGAMGVTGVLIALYLFFKKEKVPEEMKKSVDEYKSPFAMGPALKFGFVFALILLVSKFANETLGDSGIYLTSFFSGLMDVDAITLTMANLAKDGSVVTDTAVTSIVIAAIVNTLSKAGIFILFGGKKVAKKVLISFVTISAVGGVMLLFM